MCNCLSIFCRCDHFEGFMTVLSLAGGTGSGLGAYVNTALRDQYSNAFICNQVSLYLEKCKKLHMKQFLSHSLSQFCCTSHTNAVNRMTQKQSTRSCTFLNQITLIINFFKKNYFIIRHPVLTGIPFFNLRRSIFLFVSYL